MAALAARTGADVIGVGFNGYGETTFSIPNGRNAFNAPKQRHVTFGAAAAKRLGWGTDTGCRAKGRLRSTPVEPVRLAPAKGCLS